MKIAADVVKAAYRSKGLRQLDGYSKSTNRVQKEWQAGGYENNNTLIIMDLKARQVFFQVFDSQFFTKLVTPPGLEPGSRV